MEIEDLSQTPSSFLILWVFRDGIVVLTVGYFGVDELLNSTRRKRCRFKSISACISSATILLEKDQIHISRAPVDPKLRTSKAYTSKP